MCMIYSSLCVVAYATGSSASVLAATSFFWTLTLTQMFPAYLGASLASNAGWLLILLSGFIVSILTACTPLYSVTPQMFKFLGINLLLLPVLTSFFMASSMIELFCYFEFSAVMIFIMILGWGYQPERFNASLTMVLYTATSAMPLIMVFLTYSSFWGFAPLSLATILSFSGEANSSFLGSAFLLAFLVKFPMYAVHAWLPKAHVEASAGGSMLLAAVLLKMGGYGMIWFVPWMPTHSSFILSMWAIFGGAVVSILCVRQSDMKVLIAYSSVAHMSLAISCLLTKTFLGVMSAMMILIAHGISSSLLFMAAGELYALTMSRQFYLNSGLLMRAPLMTAIWFIGAMANMGTPPLMNFWAEFLGLTALISASPSHWPTLVCMLFMATLFSMLLYGSVQVSKVKTSAPTQAPSMSSVKVLLTHVLLLIFGIPSLAHAL